MKNIKPFYFFLIWVFGFFVLLSFDLFMEGIVFELLEWNGTTKNDWFLLYGGVLLWFGLYSEQKPYMKKLQKSYKVKKIPLKPFLYKGLKLGYY